MSRIGIDFRFLANQHTIYRGMGRYTIQQVRAVLKQDIDTEYILFCQQDADLSLIPQDICRSQNLHIEPVFDSHTSLITDFAGMMRRSEEIQQQLEVYNLALFHLTTPFDYNLGTPLLGFDVCPLIATHYDLIPKLYPQQYLTNPQIKQLYFTYAAQFQSADRLITISYAIQQEAMQHLRFTADQIDVAYPIPDAHFHRLPADQTQSFLSGLWKRIQVTAPQRYVMSLLANHHSKNIATLVQAYGRLPKEFRQHTPLVLVFKLSDAERNGLLNLARQAGLHDHEFILTGYVNETELNALYNGAAVLVHPSRYEGFGLPVVEAMRCGTPVITTTAASLPEAGGNAAILVDPENPDAFASAILRVCGDPSLQSDMRQRGLNHASTFTEEQLGQNTLAAYTKIINPAPPSVEDPNAKHTLRIALWTPLTPEPSGVGNHSANLLEPISKHGSIEVFINDNILPDPLMLEYYMVHHYSAVARRQRQHPFDIHMFQVGESRFHNYMYPFMETYPGVVILHDLLIGSHLYAEMMQQPDGLETWLAFLEQSEGSTFAAQFQKAYLEGQAKDFLEHELVLRAFIDNSLGIVVHFEEARRLVLKRYPDASVYTASLGGQKAEAFVEEISVAALRQKYGIPSQPLIIAAFGNISPLKHYHQLIEAFAELIKTGHQAELYIVGRSHNHDYFHTLTKAASAHHVEQFVHFIGEVTQSDFYGYMVACDVVVNLRYPARHQMSSTLTAAISAGKPTLISDIADWRYLPDSFCPKIPTDDREIPTLAAVLGRFAEDKGLAESIAVEARAYYEAHLTMDKTADNYFRIVADIHQQRKSLTPTIKSKMPELPTGSKEAFPTHNPQDGEGALGLASHYFNQFEILRLWEDRYSRFARVAKLPFLGFFVRTAIRVRHLGHIFTALSGFLSASLVAQHHINAELKREVKILQQRLDEQQITLSALKRELALSTEVSRNLRRELDILQTNTQPISAHSKEDHLT